MTLKVVGDSAPDADENASTPTPNATPSPLPEPTPADAQSVRDALSAGREMETSEEEGPGSSAKRDEDVPGLKFLLGIMKATFFTDLFCYHADINFAHPTRAERVNAMRGQHPKFYKWCRNTDFVARIVLMGVVTTLATVIASGAVAKLML